MHRERTKTNTTRRSDNTDDREGLNKLAFRLNHEAELPSFPWKSFACTFNVDRTLALSQSNRNPSRRPLNRRRELYLGC